MTTSESDRGFFPLAYDLGDKIRWNGGASKRDVFALVALHGLLGSRRPVTGMETRIVVDHAATIADQLITRLEGPPT